MRLIFASGAGEVQLNFMWLPTWMGLNSTLKAQIEKDLQKDLCGLPMDEGGLDRASQLVLDHLVKMFPNLPGLRDYLDALKFVETPWQE